MKTITRIQIKDAHCSDYGAGISAGPNCHKGSVFAKAHNLRYGNGVVFAVKEKTDELLALLTQEGLSARLDGFDWSVLEPSDFFEGAIIDGYRLLEGYNPKGIRCEEIQPRRGYKRCRKNLVIRPKNTNEELVGVYQ